MTDLQQAAPVTPAPERGRRPWRVVGVVLVALVLAASGGILASVSSSSKGSRPRAATGAIAGLQQTLRDDPSNVAAWATLGLDYVDQARVTVDPSYDTKAEGALAKSLALNSKDNFLADAGEASLAAARHQFASARSWALKGLAVDGYNAALYGILADAETQLGQYDAAAASVQKMLNLRPQTPALARASYVAELAGNLSSAVSLMTQARDAAASPADMAFSDYYLGELARNAGDPAKALTFYQDGLQVDPSYSALYEGRAKAEAALGRQAEAIADFTTVVSRVPQPQYVIEFGDYLQSLGKAAEAQQQYATFDVEDKLFAANGVLLDSDPTLYYADHGKPAEAVALAEKAITARPFVEMDDAYAWALHNNGQDTEALPWAHKALATGMKNALFTFHLGMIELTLGDKASARRDLTAALAINPHFGPLQVPVARQALASLGSAS